MRAPAAVLSWILPTQAYMVGYGLSPDSDQALWSYPDINLCGMIPVMRDPSAKLTMTFGAGSMC